MDVIVGMWLIGVGSMIALVLGSTPKAKTIALGCFILTFAIGGLFSRLLAAPIK